MNNTKIECWQDLVKHFRDQAKNLKARATLFLWAIVLVVLGGVVLVIALPPIIANVDQVFSDVQPPEVAEKLKDNINSRTGRLDQINGQRIDMAMELNRILSLPSATWKHIESPQENRGISTILRTPEGGLIAAAVEGIERSETILFMHRDRSGEAWTRIRPTEKDGSPLKGYLYEIAAGPARLFIAAGAEEDDNGRTVLLMRSDSNGETWTPIRPVGDQDSRLRGWLSAIVPAPGGGFIAAGFEQSKGRRDRTALLMRGDPSGKIWTRIPAPPIKGGLTSISLTPEGGFIAAGHEKSPSGQGNYILLMRGDPSGETWTALRPSDSDGSRLQGRFYAIKQARDGGFIAAGDSGHGNLLMVGDASGETWTQTLPKEEDDLLLLGTFYAISDTPDGGFVVVGDNGESPLLVRGNYNGKTWTPIRLSGSNDTLLSGTLHAVASTPDNGLIAGGYEGETLERFLLFMRSIARDKDQEFSESSIGLEQRDQIVGEYEQIIEVLERDDLLLPLDAREQLPLAKEMKQNWEANFDERDSLRENRDAIVKAWNESQPWQRISRIATRIAVIVLLIYLVQIMVNLFRYNTRLAAFYQSRADAIDLLAVSNVSLETSLNASIADVAAALSPDGIDFGKTPTPPSQQVIEILRDAASSARSGGA